MKSDLEKLIDTLEQDLKTANILNTHLIGVTLRVMWDRLWDIDINLAQRCNDLSRKILEREK